MPSPIAHAVAGYAIYKLFARRHIKGSSVKFGPLPILLGIAVLLSFLPDFDLIPGFLLGDYDQFHNSYSNSLFTGIVVALMISLILFRRSPAGFRFWFLFALLAYVLHVIMDYFGAGRGVMLFWPITDERFISPVKLFYGLHRSDGFFSIRHVWTFLTEMVFVLVLYGVVRVILREGKSHKNKGLYLNQNPLNSDDKPL